MSVAHDEHHVALDEADRKALMEALVLASSQSRADAEAVGNDEVGHLGPRAARRLRDELEESAAKAERLSMLIENADKIILTRH